MRSIRSTLVVTVLSTCALVTSIALGWGFIESRHEVEELFDAQLAQYARILDSTINLDNFEPPHPVIISTSLPGMRKNGEDMDDNNEATPQGHKYERKIAFQIWQDNDRLLAHSSNTITIPFAPLTSGFSDQESGKHLWRVFVLPRQNQDHWIIVSERDDIRSELAEKFAIQAIIPVLLFSPILIALIWFVIGAGLSPLRQITQQLERRKADDLEPIAIKPVPDELGTLLSAMNELFKRVAESFDREKEFTANAAHELRTPIAAMRIQLENALIDNRDNEKKALKKVLTGLDRMTRIVEQLLLLARMEPANKAENTRAVNLYELAREVVAEQAEMAVSKSQDISLTGNKHIELNLNPVASTIILRNLVSNAIHYTQQAGEIRIEVNTNSQGDFIRVSDNGPGVPGAALSKLFDRFYRHDNDRHGSGVDGSGLGLTIVKELAQRHGATITIENAQPGPGLIATVHFNQVFTNLQRA
jgi:two-component system sensor histidine kinase QseC